MAVLVNDGFDRIRQGRQPVAILIRPDPARVAGLAHLLSAEELQLNQQFRCAEDRNSHVAAHALKRLMLHQATGLPVSSLRFACDEFGKPHLVGSDLAFSLSHTRGLAAVAVSSAELVGIDAEAKASAFVPGTDLLELGVLSASDLASIARADVPALTFLRMWTAKEAVSKAVGRGLSMSFAEIAICGTVACAESRRWRLHFFEYPAATHVVAAATPDGKADMVFACFDEQNLP